MVLKKPRERILINKQDNYKELIMKIASITEKTIKIEATPGECLNVDNYGWAYNSVILRFDGNITLRQSIIDLVGQLNAARKDKSEYGCYKFAELLDIKQHLLCDLINKLPKYSTQKVYVGYNY